MRPFLLILAFIPAVVFAQRTRHFIVVPDTAGKPVSYGSVIALHFYEEKNGARKEMTFMQAKRLLEIKTSTPGCTIKNGNLIFPWHSNLKELVLASISIKPTVSTIQVDPVTEIKMNFRDTLRLNYDGASGYGGNNGKNGGEGFFKGCTDCWGDNGGSGSSGINGSNVTIHIKKELDTLLKKEIYFLYTSDQQSGRKAVYRYTDLSTCIMISSNGGEGASGGMGGDGKDGENSDPPTEGADGGNGGDGASGGNGGIISIIVHPNAADIKDHINVSVNGGKGGGGGYGGKGGAGGSYRYSPTNIYTARSGTDGRNGSSGSNGAKGAWSWVVVEF